MAYTHKTNGAIIEISRNDLVLATYDPITEETNYVNPSYAKYSGQVGRVIAEMKQAPADETPKDETPEVKSEKPTKEKPAKEKPVDLEAEVKRLKNLVSLLQVENANLKGTISKHNEGASVRQPERFEDAVDLTGAPVRDKMLGDLTPAFVEWARKNMPKEVFEKRYKNRLKEAK